MKGLISSLSFEMSNCEVVTFTLVSLVRCGASVYRFMIFALFLTFRMDAILFEMFKVQSDFASVLWVNIYALM